MPPLTPREASLGASRGRGARTAPARPARQEGSERALGEALANPPTLGSLPGATTDAGSQRVLTLTRAHRASSCAGVPGCSALERPPGNGASRRPCEHPGHGLLRTNERKYRELRGGASWLPPGRRVRGLVDVTLIDSSVTAGPPSALTSGAVVTPGSSTRRRPEREPWGQCTPG